MAKSQHKAAISDGHELIDYDSLFSLLDRSSLGLFWLDQSDRIFRVNRTAAKALGYSADEVIGQKFAPFVLRETSQHSGTPSNPHWNERQPRRMRETAAQRATFWRKDGSTLPVEYSLQWDESGTGRNAVVTFLDRSASADRVVPHEVHQKRLLEALPHMIWTAAPDGRTEYINQHGMDQLGEAIDTIHGWGWLQLLHPDDVEGARIKWEVAIRTTNYYRNEYRVRQADGGYRWYLSQALPLRGVGDEVEMWVGTWTDIDVVKRAEEKLARDATLLANVCDSIIVTDLEGIVTYWNEGATQLFGWSHQETVGRPLVDRYPPERRGQFTEVIRSIVDGVDWSGEYEGYRKDGTRIWIDARMSLIRNEVGQPIGLMGISHDISARRQVEMERERLIALIEASPDFIGIADANQQAIYRNRAGQELLGLAGLDEVRQIHIRDYFSDQEWQRVESEIMPLLKKNSRWEGEVEFQHLKTKARIPMRWSAFTVPAEKNGSFYLAWFGHDLTQKKALEAVAQAGEQRFRAFMDQSPMNAWITDVEGHLEYMNGPLLRTCPDLKADDVGKTPLDVHDPTLAEVYVNRIKTVVETGQAIGGIEPGPRTDGTIGEFMVYRFPIPNPDGEMTIGGVAFDVTEQRRTENNLRLRDRAIQALQQGITITDPNQLDNPVIYASPGFLRLTGYELHEVLGRNCRFLRGPDTDPVASAQLEKAVCEERPVMVELLNYRKDGAAFWSEVSISPVFDTSGELVNFVGVQTDVTQRRQLEEQFRQSRKMEAIGQLAGGIAHDFNNLMTIIIAYSDLLLQSRELNPTASEQLVEISKAGERAASLTRQLLAFSRHQLLVMDVVDLNVVIRDMETMLRRVIGEDIEISTMLQPELGHVLADSGQLAQVLLNLAVNARDAMPQGGKLVFETRNVQLSEQDTRSHAAVAPGGYVMLTVTDTGSGMSHDVMQRVFEPFFTTKKIGAGTGLGLSVVHGVVKQSNGHIDVESTLGAGTTFRILLPRTERTPSAIKQASMPAICPRGGETVLLVEDESAVRQLSSRILGICGYTVLEAEDADRALAVAREHSEPIHLLIADVVMPGIGGRHLAEQLLEDRPSMRVLFVSGYLADTVVRHGVAQEDVDFLAKPFSPLALAQAVRNTLDKN